MKKNIYIGLIIAILIASIGILIRGIMLDPTIIPCMALVGVMVLFAVVYSSTCKTKEYTFYYIEADEDD